MNEYNNNNIYNPLLCYNSQSYINNSNNIIKDMLSIIASRSKPLTEPFDVIHCTSEIKIIASDNGAICPYCDSVLKNRTTLNMHMKKCQNK